MSNKLAMLEILNLLKIQLYSWFQAPEKAAYVNYTLVWSESFHVYCKLPLFETYQKKKKKIQSENRNDKQTHPGGPCVTDKQYDDK